MPIFEYKCKACDKEFEQLVFGQETPACPVCESNKVCKLMSTCGFVSKGAAGQTVSSSSSSCTGCKATSCSSCSG
ncbi:MAG: zinc ribbon domain-containing protein [Desulfobacteraceae bacterium]|nr:zinc ribbon domain-containing protein [Desulfobacteraceae bacterium]